MPYLPFDDPEPYAVWRGGTPLAHGYARCMSKLLRIFSVVLVLGIAGSTRFAAQQPPAATVAEPQLGLEMKPDKGPVAVVVVKAAREPDLD